MFTSVLRLKKKQRRGQRGGGQKEKVTGKMTGLGREREKHLHTNRADEKNSVRLYDLQRAKTSADDLKFFTEVVEEGGVHATACTCTD